MSWDLKDQSIFNCANTAIKELFFNNILKPSEYASIMKTIQNSVDRKAMVNESHSGSRRKIGEVI